MAWQNNIIPLNLVKEDSDRVNRPETPMPPSNEFPSSTPYMNLQQSTVLVPEPLPARRVNRRFPRPVICYREHTEESSEEETEEEQNPIVFEQPAPGFPTKYMFLPTAGGNSTVTTNEDVFGSHSPGRNINVNSENSASFIEQDALHSIKKHKADDNDAVQYAFPIVATSQPPSPATPIQASYMAPPRGLVRSDRPQMASSVTGGIMAPNIQMKKTKYQEQLFNTQRASYQFQSTDYLPFLNYNAPSKSETSASGAMRSNRATPYNTAQRQLDEMNRRLTIIANNDYGTFSGVEAVARQLYAPTRQNFHAPAQSEMFGGFNRSQPAQQMQTSAENLFLPIGGLPKQEVPYPLFPMQERFAPTLYGFAPVPGQQLYSPGQHVFSPVPVTTLGQASAAHLSSVGKQKAAKKGEAKKGQNRTESASGVAAFNQDG